MTLHYVTAREAYNLVKAAEMGASDPPEDYYDRVIPPPMNVLQDLVGLVD